MKVDAIMQYRNHSDEWFYNLTEIIPKSSRTYLKDLKCYQEYSFELNLHQMNTLLDLSNKNLLKKYINKIERMFNTRIGPDLTNTTEIIVDQQNNILTIKAPFEITKVFIECFITEDKKY